MLNNLKPREFISGFIIIGNVLSMETKIFKIGSLFVHKLTNPKIAWSDVKNFENVYCMHSKDVHFIYVDLPLTDINEIIEAWLFDDENYPACNRLVRRFAKRTSKRKLYRKCKEKHKT
jgi:hypothetical protein